MHAALLENTNQKSIKRKLRVFFTKKKYRDQQILAPIFLSYLTSWPCLCSYFTLKICPPRQISSKCCSLYRKNIPHRTALSKHLPSSELSLTLFTVKTRNVPWVTTPLVFTSDHLTHDSGMCQGPRLIHLRTSVLAQCPIYPWYSTNVCWMNNPMCFPSAWAARRVGAKCSYQVQ